MKRRFRPAGMSGFTLLEVLVAVALLSVVLAAVYSTFFLSARALAGLDDSLLRLQEARSVLDQLSREMESLRYDPNRPKTLFKTEDRDLYGKPTSRISFTAFAPLIPGLSLISYFVETTDNKPVLYKTMRSVVGSAETKPVPLIEGIDSFSVEVKEGNTWVRTFDTTETLRRPAELRLSLTVMVKDKPVTLFASVTPKVDRAI